MGKSGNFNASRALFPKQLLTGEGREMRHKSAIKIKRAQGAEPGDSRVSFRNQGSEDLEPQPLYALESQQQKSVATTMARNEEKPSQTDTRQGYTGKHFCSSNYFLFFSIVLERISEIPDYLAQCFKVSSEMGHLDATCSSVLAFKSRSRHFCCMLRIRRVGQEHTAFSITLISQPGRGVWGPGTYPRGAWSLEPEPFPANAFLSAFRLFWIVCLSKFQFAGTVYNFWPLRE